MVLFHVNTLDRPCDGSTMASRFSVKWVVRMLFTVVLLFTVCWLPYHVYFLYVFHNPSVVQSDDVQHVYLAMYWLAMSHAMYNPIVYYFMNHRDGTPRDIGRLLGFTTDTSMTKLTVWLSQPQKGASSPPYLDHVYKLPLLRIEGMLS
ncbi:hypothetical protein HPB48_017213 [Haemaphysalis longicornis]|uniref:G-protein coupled receptors family 1 profile domain-containing protein n=1 Tax=Haemaphysalis longicornis TaxID=44386 RepID=A0A9J6FBP5_HAELO|nr:hypothetical protein HPB48_017213 [Haemaphysalis longicornis]